MNAIDTNILVYAFDADSPEKQKKARQFLSSLDQGVILWQVACEFLNSARKIAALGSDPAVPYQRLRDLLGRFPLVLPDGEVLRICVELRTMHQLQYWDAMLYAGCIDAGVTRLFSEDVPGERVNNLQIVDPFG